MLQSVLAALMVAVAAAYAAWALMPGPARRWLRQRLGLQAGAAGEAAGCGGCSGCARDTPAPVPGPSVITVHRRVARTAPRPRPDESAPPAAP